MPSKRILIVDDDPCVAGLLASHFANRGFRIETAASIHGMMRQLKTFSFDAVLLDLMLGEESGLSALPNLFELAPYCKIFVLTAHGSIQVAVDAMRKGVTGFLTKDSGPEEILRQVEAHLCKPMSESHDHCGSTNEMFGIIGDSEPILMLRRLILRLKDVDSTVLITGESGTGKELVARALHTTSKGIDSRFEAINCGAIPEHLLEAELFGHKRGSFTDAKVDRKGIFEICSEGTLFLDEIGEMPLNLQSKLLRVLQEKEVTPIGSTRSIKVNTRVLTATNRDLLEEVKAGRFRQDLYFRISVVPVQVPPLRDRSEDILVLTNFFIEKFNARFGKKILAPSKEVISSLLNYSWPGNVRELQNAIERGIVLSQDNQLSIDDMFLGTKTFPNAPRALRVNLSENAEINLESLINEIDTSESSKVFSLPLSDAKREFEKAYLTHLLRVTQGNITEAASKSGRYRADIYRLMNKYSVKSGYARHDELAE